MKVFTLTLAVTFLLISTTLGIAGEDPDLVAYYPFEGNAGGCFWERKRWRD